MTVHPARRLWLSIETLHAVTYFAPVCREAAAAVGLKGFWMGYFAFRAAPLGPVVPAAVVATFAGFRPSMVERALPDAWGHATPAACLEARSTSGMSALAEAGADLAALSVVATRLAPVVANLDPTGRPLGAANAAVAGEDTSFWQLATTLREHRGDGHIAALVGAGLSGLDAHLLQLQPKGLPDARLRDARGWTEDEWEAARAGLAARGVDGDVLAGVEHHTDELAWSGGLSALGESGVDEIVAALAPAVAAVAATGWIPYPNPIGLPAPD